MKKVLVANKIDIEDRGTESQNECLDSSRRVSTERGQAIAIKHDMEYYEVSAKNNEGIQEMFEDLSLQIKDSI